MTEGFKMLKIIDTYGEIPELFENGTFAYPKWETYINSIYPDAAHLFADEVAEYLASGKYTFERDFLPVIDAVCENEKLSVLHENFCTLTKTLDSEIVRCFGRGLDVDLVLYLGLCNAAGWVKKIGGRDTVLFGVEKIIELDWHGLDAMRGLIYHELGHIYHAQHGSLWQSAGDARRDYIWQLFTEGVAMYFEQALVGNFSYYHQDKDGWAMWCEAHFREILADFDADIADMTRFDQRYFGDWSDYRGHSDVGYYLGARFVQHLTQRRTFDELVSLTLPTVYERYKAFVRTVLT